MKDVDIAEVSRLTGVPASHFATTRRRASSPRSAVAANAACSTLPSWTGSP
ncbi:hypothetical protein [Mesorhizobium sp. 131-2-5]|uniref:hypothetical protein n=1 Tax=Mesorhizobium sp. 131-2-5 TaxID=2744519 RepID=UPI00313C237C